MKPCYQCSGQLVPDIFSQADFMPVLTYQSANMLSLVQRWVKSIGLDSASYGTHSMRRTPRFYRKTGNLRAVQLLLGHTAPSDISELRWTTP